MQQIKCKKYKMKQTETEEQQLTTQQIEYSRTIVPASMRSAYWKYFGFPSDSANNILTRQKIICTLCNTAIAYNKNTSNLRTHLISRHPELLHELQQAAGVTAATTSGSSVATPRKRKHQGDIALSAEVDAVDAVDVAADTTIELAQHTKYTRDHSENCTSLLVVADTHSEFVELTDAALKAQELIEASKQQESDDELAQAADDHSQHSSNVLLPNTDSVDYNDFVDANEVDDTANSGTGVSAPAPEVLDVAQPYSYVDILTPMKSRKLIRPTQSAPGLDLYAEMLVLDLLPINTLTGRGFQQLLLQQCGEAVDTTAVAQQLCTFYTHMQVRINSYIEQLAQKAPYALSIETYWNIENCQISCIYFNYFDAEYHQLANVLYQTANCKDMNLSNCLQHLELNNCAALIVASEEIHSSIADFAAARTIPVFECLDAVLTRCFKQIFDLPCIMTAFEQVASLIVSQADEKLLTLPEIQPNCPWSKFNMLQYAVQHDMLKDMHNDNNKSTLADMQEFVEYISPLKITLETTADEPLPLCTLLRPLIIKLFEEHFATYTNQTAHVQQAGAIIETELTKSIINNQYLHEATFFDVRFQHDFIDKQTGIRTQLQRAICQRFKHLIDLTNVTQKSTIKLEQDLGVESSSDDVSGSRKSGLKSFFTRINNSNNGAHASRRPVTQPTQKSSIDLEFDRYMSEPALDLEQCPISWWQEHAYYYKQLYKIASNYLCVPCCVNRWFRYDANERLAWRNKRFMLRHQRYSQRPQQQSAALAETCLWYLHYNKLFYDKLNAGVK